MWVEFALGVAICVLFAYLPGWLFLRGLSFSNLLSITIAPVISILEYGLLALCLACLKIPCNWVFLFSICLLPGISLILTSRLAFGNTVELTLPNEKKNNLWLAMIAFVFVSTFITVYIFVKTLDGPDSFIAANDATKHINTIHQFAVTGFWSIISTGSYYPEGFSELCAMLVQAMNISAPCSANVLVSVILMAIFPLSMFGLLSTCFSKQPVAIYCGAVMTLSLTGFPWNFLPTDQLSSNLLGFSLVPTGLMLVVMMLNGIKDKGVPKRLAVCTIAFLLSCAFTHPSALFTTGVLVFPYVVSYLASLSSNRRGSAIPRAKKAVMISLTITIIVLIWVGCYHLPFLSSTVNFKWPAWASPLEALEYIVTLSFADNPAQWIAMVALFVGIVYSLRNRNYLWMTAGFLIFCCFFFIGLTMDGEFKQILLGFWYTSTRRLAASACIIAVPLCCLGGYAVIRLITEWMRSPEAIPTKLTRRLPFLVAVALSFAFVLINFCPSFTLTGPSGRITTAFGYLSDKLTLQNDTSLSSIDSSEKDFLNRVKPIVGDSLVFNIPHDGSAYAYALSDINTYGRTMIPPDDDVSLKLRSNLSNISSDVEVQNAVDASGIEYILLLDFGLTEDSTILRKDFGLGQFEPSEWSGILSIEDSTPGLELVLSEGDMRLYKVQK